MHYLNFLNFNPFPFFGFGGFFWPFFLLWSLFWNGWALWEAAKNEDKGWFIILLVIETVGILEIAYLFFLARNAKTNAQKIKQLFSK